jgi:hypothetical protein
VLIDGLQGSAEVLFLHLPGSIYEIHKALSQEICYPAQNLYWAPCKHKLEALLLHRPAQFHNALGL